MNDLPPSAIGHALRLIGAVHEHGPDDVAGVLTGLTRQELYALAVTLAATTPDDYTPVELLAWNDSRWTPVEAPTEQTPLFAATIPSTRRLRPHGTHAAFVRHRKHREEPCNACWYGEREYQRERGRRKRQEESSTSEPAPVENCLQRNGFRSHDARVDGAA